MYQTLNRSINTHHLSSFSQQRRWGITMTKNDEAEAQRGYITSQAARTWEAGGQRGLKAAGRVGRAGSVGPPGVGLDSRAAT